MEKFQNKVWLSSPTMHGPELEYVKEAAAQGTRVLIANGKYSIREVLEGKVPCTSICVR